MMALGNIVMEKSNLFPVRIYSQKQIYELAKKPSALIEIIDEASRC